MAGDDRTHAAAAPEAPTVAEEETDSHDHESAEVFDGPEHKTYDATLEAPLSGREHKVKLEVTEDTFEVADGMFMNLWSLGGQGAGPGDPRYPGRHDPFQARQQGTDGALDGLLRGGGRAQPCPHRCRAGDSFELEWKAVQPGVFMYQLRYSAGAAPHRERHVTGW